MVQKMTAQQFESELDYQIYAIEVQIKELQRKLKTLYWMKNVEDPKL